MSNTATQQKFSERFGLQDTDRVEKAYREFVKALVWESNYTCEGWPEEDIDKFIDEQTKNNFESDCVNMHDLLRGRSWNWYDSFK